MKKLFRTVNRHSSDGHAAVEFAMIAPIFFLLLMGIIETGLVYFASSTLQNGMQTAARMIRTGQVASGGTSKSAFRQVVCDQIKSFMSCDSSQLYIDVRAFTGFGAATYPQALDVNGNINPNLDNYQTGSSCQVVLVRAFYTWKLFTPIFAQYFANMSDSTRLLSASVAFRNEPWGSAPC